MIKKCKLCGADFEAKGRQLFCCAEHARRYNYLQNTEAYKERSKKQREKKASKRTPLPKSVCKNCNKEFQPSVESQSFCSKKCRVSWHNKHSSKKYFQSYYEKNKESIKESVRTYAANNKEKVARSKHKHYIANIDRYKDYHKNYYLKHKSKIRKYYSQWYCENKDFVYAYISEWREKNADKTKQYRENYAKSPKGIASSKIHRARRGALKKGTNYKKVISNFSKVLDGCNFLICEHCGKRIEGFSFHLDHIVPLSKGGEHKFNNFAISCPTCNLKKGAKSLLTFMQDSL